MEMLREKEKERLKLEEELQAMKIQVFAHLIIVYICTCQPHYNIPCF